MKGRIGVAKRVHRIVRSEKLSTGELWGVSACGWAGLCEVVITEEISCQACLR